MQNQLYQQPIPVRCDLISRWIDECTIKELECLFPPIVDDIFGISNKVGWDLLFIEFTTNPIDYENIFKFLHPSGPIFRLCYKLLSDPYIKYKFPLSFLPMKVRESIEDGSAPTFYIEKLEVDPRTRTPLNLSLNAFELYMFHFVYHVVNPMLKQSQYQESRVLNSVYLRLAEEYLSTFLPCDCSTVQPELHNHYISQTSHRSVQQKPVRTSTLFRQDVLVKMLKQSPVTNPLQTSPHVGIWRSELQVQLCIDFWLSTPNSQNLSPLWTDSQLPSCEHLHVVRMLVKHLHYFANGLIEDSSAMDELKKAIIPSSQRKVYHFIRQTMQHWPLDASFKQILEIWLSYIQPWRYISYQTRYYRPRGEMTEVSSRWLPFIAENLLVYSVIFHQLVDRFKMIDLASSKNAYMLFRVTKVFSLPNLSELLMKVEGSLGELDTQGYSKWVHSHLLDLEGPSFQYKPVFSADSNIQALLKLVKEAEYQAILRLREEQKKHDDMSFWERFFVGGGCERKSLTERKNITLFLSASLKNLTQMFQIPEDSIENGNSLLESTPLSSRTPTSIYEVSPEQMRSVKELAFEGDPDLQPIRSYENAFLVRILYHLCLWINYNYSSQMQSLYTRRDMLGGMARQVLCGPQVIYHFDKQVPGRSPRVSTSLPPRLSLRVLANYHLLGYSALALLFVSLQSGLSLSSVAAVFLLLWLGFLAARWLCGCAPITPMFSVHDISDSRPGHSFNG